MKTFFSGWPELLGAAGMAGVGLLAFSGALYFGSLVPAENRRDALASEQKRVESAGTGRSAGNESIPAELVQEQLQTFYAILADERSIGDVLARIDEIARRNGVILRRGNYRIASDRDGRFGRHEVSYSGEAAYFRARVFIRETLSELPMISRGSRRPRAGSSCPRDSWCSSGGRFSMIPLSRRHLLLATGLVAALAMSILAPSEEVSIEKSGRTRVLAPAAKTGSPGASPTEVPQLASFTRSIEPGFVVLDLFDAKPLPGAVSAPPKPVAPPLPFIYVGSLGDAGNAKTVLAQGSEMFVLSPGDRFAANYRFDGADTSEVRITFVPLDAVQRLPTGAGK